jgi:hypothetical protein
MLYKVHLEPEMKDNAYVGLAVRRGEESGILKTLDSYSR